MTGTQSTQLFDDWPEKYDRWFETPIGSLVKKVEGEIITSLLRPEEGDLILDAGCGTGVFTLDMLGSGAGVVGLDLSLPMVRRAREKAPGSSFEAVLGDILHLPFPDRSFDKTVSVTALEFIADGAGAVQELFRVTRKGGLIVAATLNSLSPWAGRRREEARKGHSLFQKVLFRSPEELAALAPVKAEIRTAVHFAKDDPVGPAAEAEREGARRGLQTGAFLAARWVKP